MTKPARNTDQTTAKPPAKRRLVDLKATLANVRKAINTYNSGKPLSQQVRQQVQSTAFRIYSLYSDEQAAGRIVRDSFLHNGARIASDMGYVPRTFDNHIDRLELAAIAYRCTPLEYKHKIRKANAPSSEIRVNPSLIVYQEMGTDST